MIDAQKIAESYAPGELVYGSLVLISAIFILKSQNNSTHKPIHFMHALVVFVPALVFIMKTVILYAMQNSFYSPSDIFLPIGAILFFHPLVAVNLVVQGLTWKWTSDLWFTLRILFSLILQIGDYTLFKIQEST